MDKMPFVNLILQSIPESILLLLFGLGLFKHPFKISRVFIGAVISAAISYFIRSLQLPYGIHAGIGVIVLTLVFWLIIRMDIGDSLVASLGSLTTLGIIEVFLLPIQTHLFGLQSFDQAWPNAQLRLIMATPELVIFSYIVYLLNKGNLPFQKFKRSFMDHG